MQDIVLKLTNFNILVLCKIDVNLVVGLMDHDNELFNVTIADGETPSFENEANRLKDYAMPQEVKEAHNKYVALLDEWRFRTSRELNELLLTTKIPV